jgi:hypothetical protein
VGRPGRRRARRHRRAQGERLLHRFEQPLLDSAVLARYVEAAREPHREWGDMVYRIDVHIVSHYREGRVKHLGLTLDAISEWKGCILRVVVTSNTDRYQSTGFLSKYESIFSNRGHKLELNVVDNLDNPRLLTWAHKKYLPEWTASASNGEDYFFYIEDDLVLTNANITYFIRNQKTLAQSNLIPGFLRYENKGDEVRLVDVFAPEYWERERSLNIDGNIFHANKNPYWGGFGLNKDLAQEYLRSRSFSLEQSNFVQHWNVQERAAMGLTWENPSKRLKTRVVVPIVNGAPDPGCLIWHCSNNYSEDDHPVIARLTVERAYLRESVGAYAARTTAKALRRMRIWRS